MFSLHKSYSTAALLHCHNNIDLWNIFKWLERTFFSTKATNIYKVNITISFLKSRFKNRISGLLQLPSSLLLNLRSRSGLQACRCPPSLFNSFLLKNSLQPLTAQVTKCLGTTTGLKLFFHKLLSKMKVSFLKKFLKVFFF